MLEARVLVLGGLTDSQSDVMEILGGAGIALDHVDSRDEACRLLAHGRHQVLITGLDHICRDDGAFIDEAHRSHPGLCVLAVATQPSAEDLVCAMRRGTFDCLLRPFSSATLLQALKRGLENRMLYMEFANLSRQLQERGAEMEERARRVQRDRDEMQAIIEIARAMTSSLNLEEILNTILGGIHRVLDFDRVVLALINKDRNAEEAKLSTGSEDEEFRRQSWRLDDPQNPWMADILEKRKTVVVDPLRDAAYAGTPAARLFPSPFVKVPMFVKGSVIGTITADNSNSSRVITPEDVRRLELFSDHAGIAIENARLYYDILRSKEEVLRAQKQLVEAERMAALGAMAASINHEINNPLCAIALDAQLMLMTLSPEQEKMKRRVESIENSVKRIRAVTEKVAAVKRTILTEYQPRTEMIDLDLSSK